MLVLSLGPVFGVGLVGLVLVGLLLALIVVRRPNVEQPHDWEAANQRLTRKLREPWKAKASWMLGLD